jgi:hypothetical protein
MTDPPAHPAPLNFSRIIAASFGVVHRRWASIGLVVAVQFALEVGDRLVHLPLLDRPAQDAFALALQIGVGVAWGAIDLQLDTTIIALALEATGGASVAKASMTSIHSIPALLPFQILSMLPWLIGVLWRQPYPPDFDTPMEQAVFLFALLAQGAFGVGLTAAWGLIAPVAAAERCGARAAFSRSWRRLSGSRWVLAWLNIAIIATVTITSVAASQVALSMSETLGWASIKLAMQVENWVMSTLSLMMTTFRLVLTAVSYRQHPTLAETLEPSA